MVRTLSGEVVDGLELVGDSFRNLYRLFRQEDGDSESALFNTVRGSMLVASSHLFRSRWGSASSRLAVRQKLHALLDRAVDDFLTNDPAESEVQDGSTGPTVDQPTPLPGRAVDGKSGEGESA